MREPKIWPFTPSAASLISPQASGAILSGVKLRATSSRARFSSVLAGIVPTIRVNANGAMQLERTLKRCMSIAIDFDRPATPSFAAE